MLIDDSWAFAFALASTIGSISTAIALYFLWRQSNRTQKQIDLTQQQIQLKKDEIDSTVRPWIGIGSIERNDLWYVTIELKNHGSIPAKVIKSNELFSPREITQAEILSSKNEYGYEYLIFPGSTVIHISNQNISQDVQGEDVKFAGISIEYEYSKNKLVPCGFTARYQSIGGRFVKYEEFSKDIES